jgi:hypothetical protein
VTSPRPPDAIDVRHPLTLASSLRFPLQSAESRRDLVIGGLWLLVPVVGWLMNMGHRIVIVHRMHRGQTPWPAWQDPRALLKHGVFTFLGMVWYGWPGVGLMALGWWWRWPAMGALGLVLWALAVIAIPGYTARPWGSPHRPHQARRLRRETWRASGARSTSFEWVG